MSNSEPNKERIKLDAAECFVLENGIIQNNVRTDVVLDSKDILEIKSANNILSNNSPYALLIVSGELSSITKEGRETSSVEENRGNNIATAILIHSLAQKIIGNFYMQINKPVIDTKIFNDEEKALKWLRSKVNENVSI